MKCSGRGCKTAVGSTSGCRCQCGGINHGLGRIYWASNPTSSVYSSAKFKAIKHVKSLKTASKPKVLTSQGSARILQEYIRTVAIVTWLINSSPDLNQLQGLCATFQNTATTAMSGLTKNQLQRFSDHFWCDFFASLVYLINNTQNAQNQIQKSIAGKISNTLINEVFSCIKNSRGNSYGNPLAMRQGNRETRTRETRDLHEGLGNNLLKKIVTNVLVASFAPYSSQLNIQNVGVSTIFDSMKVHFQILALLLCPDPESHKLVWDQCFAPLFTVNCLQPLKNIVQPLKDTLTNKNISIPLLDTWD